MQFNFGQDTMSCSEQLLGEGQLRPSTHQRSIPHRVWIAPRQPQRPERSRDMDQDDYPISAVFVYTPACSLT